MGRYYVSKKTHTIRFYGKDYDSSYEDYFKENYPNYEIYVDYDEENYNEDEDVDYDDDEPISLEELGDIDF